MGFMMGGLGFRCSLFAMLTAATPALAGDLPSTPDGAAKLVAVIKTYFGGAPTVTADGKAYLVSVEPTAPTTLMGSQDFKIEPFKVNFKLFAQDDGSWRMEQSDLPQISWSRNADKGIMAETLTFSGYNQVSVFDPALGALRSGQFAADKMTIHAILPNGKEDIELNGMKGTTSGAAAGEGAVSTTVNQSIDSFNFSLAAEPKPQEGKPAPGPFSLSGKGGAATGNVKVDGLNTKPLLDLWAFMVAHPQRADLAADEAAFKTKLAAAASGAPTVAHKFEGGAISFTTEKGGVTLDKAAGGAGGGMLGPKSYFEEHVSLSGIALSEGLAPAIYKPLIPTAVDIGVRLSGFDLNAAAQEAISDFKLAGDGPWLGKEENDRVIAKLVSAGPLIIEIPLSHVQAPSLDLTLEARAEYGFGGKPTGKATIRMRNFDAAVAALKGLGPDAEQKLVPVLAMAKGLGKVDGDQMVWVCEIGADRIIKVNGLPLGKAPI